MINWLAWRDIDGEVVWIREGDSGVGLIGPNHTRVQGLDRVTSSDELSPNDFYTRSEIDAQQSTQDNNITQNTNDITTINSVTYVNSVNGEVGVVEDVAKTDEENTFTQKQEILHNEADALCFRRTANENSIGLSFRNSGTFYEAAILLQENASAGIDFFTSGSSVNLSTIQKSLSINNDKTLQVFGDILGETNQAKNFADPTDPQDLATRNYVDANIATNSDSIANLLNTQTIQDVAITQITIDTESSVQIGNNISLLNNDSNYITALEAPVQSVNGETGSIANVAKTDEANDFTENQRITDDTNPLLVFGDNNNRLTIGYDETVNYTPGRNGSVSAEVISDRNGDIHYSTRPISSSIGHTFYTSVSGVLNECFRIAASGINGFLKQAKNFADPTDNQDLVTKNYALERVLVATNTNNTTNVNTVAYTDTPVFGNIRMVNDNASFTTISPTQVQVNFDGEIEVNVNIPMTSTGQRATVQGVLALNGTIVGPNANTGYIRAVNGHNEASHHLAGVYLQVSNGDILSYQMRRETTPGSNITLIANRGQISIKKINT